jgi:hypothetical protein
VARKKNKTQAAIEMTEQWLIEQRRASADDIEPIYPYRSDGALVTHGDLRLLIRAAKRKTHGAVKALVRATKREVGTKAKHRELCFVVVKEALDWFRESTRQDQLAYTGLARACAALEKFETGAAKRSSK